MVPGVSGATLAVIFRVYDRLINAINTLFKSPKESLKFLIPLGIGMAVGILAVVAVLDYFLINFSLQAGALIAGLMAGSIPFINKLATSQDAKKPYSYVVVAVAAGVIIALSLFAPVPDVYVDTPFSIGYAVLLFAGGLFSAGALIIPGVSGAMVMIIFGIFPIVIHTLSLISSYVLTPFDFSLLPPIITVAAPLGLGIVAGILLTSKLIAFLLKRYHGITYFAIMGLIFGTVFVIFTDDATYQSVDTVTVPLIIFAFITFLFGLVVSLKLGKK